MLSGRSEEVLNLKSKIKAGSIIYLYCDFIDTPKNKYMVFAYVDFEANESLVFIVNSDVRPLIAHDPHLRDGQVILNKDPDYPFFDHNSHLNCVEVWDCLDLEYVITCLLDNPDGYKGELKEQERNAVINYIEKAQTISKIDKETIISSLKNA